MCQISIHVFSGFRNPKIFRLFPKGVRECRDGASVSVCFCNCMTLIQSIYGISACSTAPVETHLSSSRRVCLQSFRWPPPPARPMAAPRAQSRPAPRLRRPCAAPAWAPCRRHRRQHRWRSRRARAPASAGEGTGVQLAPRELQGCGLRPRLKWVKEWLRVGRKGGKAASLRGRGGRSPLTEVLAELVGGAFARDEDDPAEGGVAPH